MLTIARSRKHITKYYRAASAPPARRQPLSFQTPIDLAGELPPIAELNDMIAQLTFAQYQLLSYVRTDRRRKYEERYGDTWGKDFESQVHRTAAVANLMRVNVLKRMESSVNSFRITLGRILDGCRDMRARLDGAAGVPASATSSPAASTTMTTRRSSRQVARASVVDLRDCDPVRLAQDLDYDIVVLGRLLAYAEAVTPERDAKLARLKSFLAEKAACPYNAGNRKVLVFSAFSDTTAYLFDELAPWLKRELGLECAEVSGDRNRTHSLRLRRTTFEAILSHFSPVSKELPEASRAEGEIDVVFATDCISEGQNLQDCDCLINYDIHWNPVRLVQRFGRIDRIGSRNEQIQLINFWPDMQLDDYINLKARVETRMKALVMTSTGDDNLLSPEEQGDLEYRKVQLQRLQTEVVDLEDMGTGVSITDLGLNEFRMELMEYAKTHPELETCPGGISAVAAATPDAPAGVVFILKMSTTR